MGVRLIAIDIDGTLLDSRYEVPEANRKAIVETVERGIEVALVTGRRFDFALPIAQQIPCELTMVVNNGAVIKSKAGATLHRHLLPRTVARRVLEATPQFRDGAAVVFDRPSENQIVYEQIEWEDPRRKSYFHRNREYISQCAPLEESLTEDPIQVMYSGPVSRMRSVEAVLRRLDGRGEYALAVTEYEQRDFGLVDVLHPGCSKGAALRELAGMRGYAQEDVMAIGDNLNDTEMLEFAGVPVVMANSVAGLKGMGWHETGSNDEAGVATAIEEYALGESKRKSEIGSRRNEGGEGPQ